MTAVQLSFLKVMTAVANRGQLDPASELLLDQYRHDRMATGVGARSIAREVSQLRAVARAAGSPGGPITLAQLLVHPGTIARVLREPRAPIARSTGHARLIAVQRAMRILGPALGRDPVSDVASLDALLPARRSAGWHTTGTVVAGRTGRRRRRGPCLGIAELRCIVDTVAQDEPEYRATRDRALVALHCFSGLRAEEIVRLSWEDLAAERTQAGHDRWLAAVRRNEQRLRLPLLGPAAEAVEALARRWGGRLEALSGPLIRKREDSAQALSYRAARDVLRRACRKVGLLSVESAELRAAFAHWLRSQGLSEHEVAAVLGVARVRTVDRLLQRHAALDAQRRVREVLLQ